jgi:hypothetical protein
MCTTISTRSGKRFNTHAHNLQVATHTVTCESVKLVERCVRTLANRGALKQRSDTSSRPVALTKRRIDVVGVLILL